MIKQVHRPGVAASRTARAVTLGLGPCCWPCGPGANQPGVPGAGKLPGVGLFREWMAKGWSGRGYPAPGIGATGPAAESPAGWPVGEAQCAAPQADSVVMVLDTTANGCCGSRGSSRDGN